MRREILAAVTFIQHFRPYLLGRQFTIRTDYDSLTWLHNFKEPEGQLTRWLKRLQEYNFHEGERTATQMPSLDYLASSVDKNHTTTLKPVEEAGQVATIDVAQSLLERSVEELQSMQENDPTVGPLLRAKRDLKKPSANVAKGGSLEMRRLCQQWE